jgi:hypothetical protein
MLQCKIFSGNDLPRVEQEVNEFLKAHSKNIIHYVVQSSSESKVHITIFFNVRTKAGKMKEAALAEVSVPIQQHDLNIN